MPTEDVSDLREVVDAINKLCDTMKSSYEADYDTSDVLRDVSDSVNQSDLAETWSEPQADVETLEMYYSATAEHELVENSRAINWSDPIVKDEPTSAEQTARIETSTKSEVMETWYMTDCSDPIVEEEPIPVQQTLTRELSIETYYMASSEGKTTETQLAERWSEPTTETERTGPHEPCSEMYYTASSEVSLLSETDLMEKVQNDDSDKEKGDRSIMAGHVAAMRERFESMTRANTPCPDLVRSLSPSLDVFRNITPSPDFLDKS